MGRAWQCSTVQVDFNMPINFNLSYINNKGEKQTPVIIHQAILGSLERFFGVILEHFKGHLPFWLCPTQIKVLPITSEQASYAETINKTLKSSGFRTILDESSEPLSAKIKVAQLEKIPWMIVLGQKEMDSNTITLRHVSGKQDFDLKLETILEMAHKANNV